MRNRGSILRATAVTLTLILVACATVPPVTPLHEAVRDGDMAKAEAEVSGGANINAQDEEGRTPLHYGCANGDVAMVELLLAAGADVNVTDDRGNSPLHYAATNCYGEIAEMIVAAGGDPSALNDAGQTPLELADEIGCMDLVDLLAVFVVD
jgi:ankyrin repeat protein